MVFIRSFFVGKSRTPETSRDNKLSDELGETSYTIPKDKGEEIEV